jgi:hypothetical protein
MQPTHNTNISTKALRAAKEALANAIEGTATLAGLFSSLRMIAEDGVCPLDSQIMSECDSMMTVTNRLLYEQDSKLKHLQAMQIVERKAEMFVARAKDRSKVHVETNVSAAI